jgi:hypothetical protein
VTAHRVGVVGALIAVAVLSLELAGAVAWKHHAINSRQASHSIDVTLEDVTAARLTLER